MSTIYFYKRYQHWGISTENKTAPGFDMDYSLFNEFQILTALFKTSLFCTFVILFLSHLIGSIKYSFLKHVWNGYNLYHLFTQWNPSVANWTYYITYEVHCKVSCSGNPLNLFPWIFFYLTRILFISLCNLRNSPSDDLSIKEYEYFSILTSESLKEIHFLW